MAKARLAIFIGPKGRGSNMLAIADNCAAGKVPAEVVAVVSPLPDTLAVEGARERGLNVEIVNPKTSEDYGRDLLHVLQRNQVEWIALAGYLRLLPTEVLAAYPNRILNVHPALLPKYGGKGMYGIRVHEAVLAAGERESGCSVHLVTENYDEGPVVLQMRCPVEPGDRPEELALRVLRLEHQAFSAALKQVIDSQSNQ